MAARIAAARTAEARLKDDPAHGNGLQQLLATAAGHERAAAHAPHREHAFAGAAGALRIAILIASVWIATRTAALRRGAGLIGAAAIAFGLLVRAGAL